MRCEEDILHADKQSAVQNDNRQRNPTHRHSFLNDTDKARKLAELPHCVDLRVYDG